MEQEVWGTCSTQAATEPALGKAGLYGRMGGTEWGVMFPILTFPSFFLPGWLPPLGASKRTGVRGAGHVPEAGRFPHPHPAGGSWWVACPSPALRCLQPAWRCLTPAPHRRGALCHLCCGCGHGDLLLPVRRHRLGEEHLHRRLHHVHGAAGAAVVRHGSGSPGHR